MRSYYREKLWKTFLYVTLLGVIVWNNFPLFWTIISSIKPEREIHSIPPTLMATRFTLEHYEKVLSETFLLRSLANSALVAICTALATIAVSGMAAYGLSRFRFTFKNQTRQMLFTFYMFPQVMLGLSFARIFVPVGLYDTLAGLVVAHLTLTIPFCTLILWPFFDAIPTEIDQAAMIDGCSRLQAFFTVILPCALRGVITTGVFAFILSWNEFTYSLFILRSLDNRTASLMLSDLIRMQEIGVRWPQLLPATVLVTVPAVVAFMLIEERLVKGLGAI